MATNQNTPVLFPQPIAAQATSENINTIPNAATGTNLASFQEGFPALTRYPVIENPQEGQVSGIPPEQQDFNGLFFSVSSHTFFIQNGGSYTFNQNVSDAIGGYPMGAILWYTPSNGTPYQVQSLIGNNSYNFVLNPSYINNVYWKRIYTDIPVGTISIWSTSTPPTGYLLCDGSAISRTTYSNLFSVIGTTYGSGDGNTTFNLPNATDRILQMSGGRGGVGTLLNESLPNFKATFQSNLQPGQTNRAALTWNQPATGTAGITPLNTNSFAANAAGTTVVGGCNGFSINLSQYNNTYQDNAPVQQKALVCCFCIKY